MDLPKSAASFIEFRDEGPVTKKLLETDRSTVTLVCLRPGQALSPFTHRRREAIVYCLQGGVRVTPGEGAAEVQAGELAFYDGSKQAGPGNYSDADAAFLVTLVRKKGD
ncbi:MAG: cupin domain-containing protein [Planctomycetota bacterium]|nr:cupin domain-containing protein [Planctomycetota bacterium]